MDYLTENVAVNLKRIRQSKGMSLDQASEQTGVSKSMLSQIEKGTANPSLGVLGKITSGLRIEFQELIATPLVDSYLVTPEDLVPTKEMEGQYTVWTCFPYEDTRLVEIYRIDIEPGGTYVSGGHPVSCAAALAEVNELIDRDLAGNAKKVGDYFAEKLAKLPHVKEVRHQGLLVGVEFDDTISGVEVKHGCLDRHLLITAIGAHIIRLIPPLIVTKEDCDKAVAIIEETVKALEK